MPIRLEDALRLYYRLVAPELARGHDAEAVELRLDDAGRREKPPHVHSSKAWEHWGVGLHRDWLEANEELVRLQADWAEACADFDVVLMPVTPVAAMQHQAAETDDREVVVNGVPQPWRVVSAWLWSSWLLHLPAASAPVGVDEAGIAGGNPGGRALRRRQAGP